MKAKWKEMEKTDGDSTSIELRGATSMIQHTITKYGTTNNTL